MLEELFDCRKCARLVAWREEVARKKRRAYQDWDYWGRPVPGFGDLENARIMVVGLAPGAHGSNRTGRMFTGDSSGVFLYRALYKAGFANQPMSVQRGDGLQLNDLYISAVCHCVPPDNKPAPDELANCQPYLVEEICRAVRLQGFIVLGKIALDGLVAGLKAQGRSFPKPEFGHGRISTLGEGNPWLLCSYHPSQQNTQTGRLTEVMFDQIWETAKNLLVPFAH
jgi:uracil-DNA glycosylase